MRKCPRNADDDGVLLCSGMRSRPAALRAQAEVLLLVLPWATNVLAQSGTTQHHMRYITSHTRTKFNHRL